MTEVPLQTALALKSTDSKNPTFALSADVKKNLQARCRADILTVLRVLEDHLSAQTFFVGERLTVADVTVYSSFGPLLTTSGLDIQLSHFPSVFRWYQTVGYQPKVAAVAPLPSSVNGVSDASVSTAHAVTSASSVNATSTAVASFAHTTNSSLNMKAKWDRQRLRIKDLFANEAIYKGQEVIVKGWIRTSRPQKQTLFVELNDGSTVKGLQLVFDAESLGRVEVENCGGVGASISVHGRVVASPKEGQAVEIAVIKADVIGPVYGGDNGEVGAKNYPMSKKGHSLEFLREKAHLRPRSKVFSCAMRMRNAMAYATHKFFNERGFVYTHTPIITAADCEGAGEQFVVTALLPEGIKGKDLAIDKNGSLDYSKDYFGRRCCLTVSGQLNVETHACALSDVYTFGPTFRAENSHTSRHLAEFWMIEPEICFATLEDDMCLAEDYVKYCAQYALAECGDDLAYFEEEYPDGEKGLRKRLLNVVESDFARITYTDAVTLLQKESAAGNVTFVKYPNWGDDLGSEHERFLAEKIYCRPTIVTNYPKGIKAFYMKLDPDGKTVAAMDILVPKIGELIGGSQREDDLVVLETRCKEMGLNPESIWWYSDMRRYGSVPHAGFGLGFERLIMFVTGLENIRDVIPFPRVPGHAEF